MLAAFPDMRSSGPLILAEEDLLWSSETELASVTTSRQKDEMIQRQFERRLSAKPCLALSSSRLRPEVEIHHVASCEDRDSLESSNSSTRRISSTRLASMEIEDLQALLLSGGAFLRSMSRIASQAMVVGVVLINGSRILQWVMFVVYWDMTLSVPSCTQSYAS